jgi:hypothetical protein
VLQIGGVVSLLFKQMKSIVLALAALLVVGCDSMVNTDPSSDRSASETQIKTRLTWQTPIYQGLRIGESTKSDVEKVFGAPFYAGPYANEDDDSVKDGKWPYIIYEYKYVGKFDGRTTVLMDAKTEIVKSISLSPIYPRQLSLTQALDLYGEPTIKLGIDANLCPLDVEKLKEQEKLVNKNTHLAFLLYPQRGMWLLVREDETVSEIVFKAKCF